jgi:hypothetical protein
MPNDKPTQIALGLFQGYPAWWKKHQSDLQRQRALSASAASTSSPASIITPAHRQVDVKQQQQQQHGNFGLSQRGLVFGSTSAKEALADSEPDTPTGNRPRGGGWRRDGHVSGVSVAHQGYRRNGKFTLSP